MTLDDCTIREKAEKIFSAWSLHGAVWNYCGAHSLFLIFNKGIYTRDVIRRLCNKDRDQGSKGIWGLGIDRMVT